MTKSRRKITSFFAKIAGLFLALLVVFSGVFEKVPVVPAYADEILAFDTTDVMDDLGSTVDLSQYPAAAGAEPELYTFMEYGYSDNAFKRGNYALYLYVYNPSQVDYVKLTGASVVNMAIEYELEEDGSFAFRENSKGEKALVATEYANLPLKYCGASSGDYENRFVKFRVQGLSQVLKNVAKMEKEGYERQYNIAGFQLHEVGDDNARDWKLGQIAYYTGYAEGLGAGAELESTLACRWENLESVELDVQHTFWRSETSSKGAGYQNQLDTVYFAVPKRLFDTYGTLQKIKAEWYEYLTKEIVVTSNTDFYEFVEAYIGKEVVLPGDGAGGGGGGIRSSTLQEYGLAMIVKDALFSKVIEFGWNTEGLSIYEDLSPIELLHYVFFNNDISSYDPYEEIVEQGGVADKKLYHWIKDYATIYGSDASLPIKEGTIAAELFEEDIPEERKLDNESGKIQKGHSYYDFDAGLDLQKWESWSESDHTIFDTWKNFGFVSEFEIKKEENVELSPIYKLTEEDILGNKDKDDLTDVEKKSIADKLYVNYNDVEKLHEFYQKAVQDSDGAGTEDEEKVVVLFRFATSDYFCYDATIIKHSDGSINETIEDEAYIAKQSVFFDFDVIQLTFNNEGVYTVIPVVADPIDIVNPITPPAEPTENCFTGLRKTLSYVIIAVVVVFVIWLIDKINQRRKLNVVYKSTKKNNKNKKE